MRNIFLARSFSMRDHGALVGRYTLTYVLLVSLLFWVGVYVAWGIKSQMPATGDSGVFENTVFLVKVAAMLSPGFFAYKFIRYACSRLKFKMVHARLCAAGMVLTCIGEQLIYTELVLGAPGAFQVGTSMMIGGLLLFFRFFSEGPA